MKLLELFSGIGGFSLGFERAGYKFDWIGYSEIDKYANEVFERRFPNAIKLGSITDVRCEDLPKDITILSGGFPCQAFSIAGKREGFNYTRGTMFFEIARILRYFKDIGKPIPYFLLENVKGLLNHEDGQTFATIYGVLTELGYTVECEIINTRQYLPQNRERIFFVGHIGDGGGSKVFPLGKGNAVLGESRGEARNGSSSYSSTITSDYRKGVHAMGETYIHAYTEKSFDGKREDGGRAIRQHKVPGESPCLSSQMGTGGNNVPMIKAGLQRVEDVNLTAKKRTFETPAEINEYLRKYKNKTNKEMAEHLDIPVTQVEHYFRADHSRAIPSPEIWLKLKEILRFDDTYDRQVTDIYEKEYEFESSKRVYSQNGIAKTLDSGEQGLYEVAPTIRAEHHNTADVHFVKKKSNIRRLTPTECARLQGFPDDWNEWQSDTQRYKQFGNAVSVPVISAIAEKMKGLVCAKKNN